MSSLITRLLVTKPFGGRETPDNTQLCDQKFASDCKTVFCNLPVEAWPYFTRVYAASQLKIDDYVFLEMRKLAYRIFLHEKDIDLAPAILSKHLKKINLGDEISCHHKLQKHHIYARSRSKLDFTNSDEWIDADFNINFLSPHRHAAHHGILENLNLESSGFFLSLVNQPGTVWSREALDQGRRLAETFSKGNRLHIEKINQLKALAGKSKSQKIKAHKP